MRLSILAVGLALFNVACDKGATESTGSTAPKEEMASPAIAEDPAGAKAPEPAAATKLEAEMGGNVVAIGDHSVELRVHRGALVEANVRDADGRAVDPASVKLQVTAQTKSGQPSAIALEWDPARTCFAGTAEAKTELDAKPIDVKLTLGEKALTGRLEHYALLAPPAFGGRTLAAGNLSAEVLASTDGSVRTAIHDASGAAVGAKATVEVALPTVGGKSHLVSLARAPSALEFAGKAGAGVELAPGPMQLTVQIDGKAEVGALAAIAIAAEAQHGGRIVTAGDYSVELVVEPPDVVAAYAFDAAGKAHATGDLALSLALGAEADREVKLEWDAPSASYRAKLEAAFEPETTPVRVALRADGKLLTGGCATFAVRSKLAARGAASGKLVTNVKASAKAPTAKAKLSTAQAATATAKAKVSPPKVSVTKSASASTSTGKDGKSGAKASAKAGISLGIK